MSKLTIERALHDKSMIDHLFAGHFSFEVAESFLTPGERLEYMAVMAVLTGVALTSGPEVAKEIMNKLNQK